MERIYKLRKSIYLDIIKNIMLVLLSIPLWLNFSVNAKEVLSNINNNHYINYEVLNKPEHVINYSEDNIALRTIETEDIVVYNDHYTADCYALLLRTDKDNNIDDIKININFEVNDLNSFVSFESGNYKYIVLDEASLEASSFKYNLSLWSSKASSNISYDFIIDNALNI